MATGRLRRLGRQRKLRERAAQMPEDRETVPRMSFLQQPASALHPPVGSRDTWRPRAGRWPRSPDSAAAIGTPGPRSVAATGGWHRWMSTRASPPKTVCGPKQGACSRSIFAIARLTCSVELHCVSTAPARRSAKIHSKDGGQSCNVSPSGTRPSARASLSDRANGTRANGRFPVAISSLAGTVALVHWWRVFVRLAQSVRRRRRTGRQ